MYSTCIFCHASLGTNEAVEHFPIGRRIAFDAARGRLWAVCRKCERWNLSPLDERWEAIEECERLFRDSRLRVSTDNIGLARLRVPYEVAVGAGQALPSDARQSFRLVDARAERTALLTGEAAMQAASKLLPAINAQGAKRAEVESAVGIIEEVSDPASLFERYA